MAEASFKELKNKLRPLVAGFMQDDEEEEIPEKILEILYSMYKLNIVRKVESQVIGHADPVKMEDELEVCRMTRSMGEIEIQLLDSLLRKLPGSSLTDDLHVMRALVALLGGHPFLVDVFGRTESNFRKFLNINTLQRACSSLSLKVETLRVLHTLSILDHNLVMIIECPDVIPFLISCVTHKNKETRWHAAGIVSRLSTFYPNRKILGESGVMRALIQIIEEKDVDPKTLKQAANALGYLCEGNKKNTELAVSQGAVHAISNKLRNKIELDLMLANIEVLSRDKRATAQLIEGDTLQILFNILSTQKKEVCVRIIHSLCLCHNNAAMRKINEEVKNAKGIVRNAMRNGTEMVMKKASQLLLMLGGKRMTREWD